MDLMIGMLAACSPFSEGVQDPRIGDNGGFEQVRDGLPVNWLVYSNKTVPTGDFDVVVDTSVFKEGRRSLRFDVREASPVGGWKSPGVARETLLSPGVYRISFWIKDEGAAWVVTLGGVTAKTADLVQIRSQDLSGSPDAERLQEPGSWRLVEREYELKPPYDRMRFELSIRSPGTVYIDDVRITEAKAAPKQQRVDG